MKAPHSTAVIQNTKKKKNPSSKPQACLEKDVFTSMKTPHGLVLVQHVRSGPVFLQESITVLHFLSVKGSSSDLSQLWQFSTTLSMLPPRLQPRQSAPHLGLHVAHLGSAQVMRLCDPTFPRQSNCFHLHFFSQPHRMTRGPCFPFRFLTLLFPPSKRSLCSVSFSALLVSASPLFSQILQERAREFEDE